WQVRVGRESAGYWLAGQFATPVRRGRRLCGEQAAERRVGIRHTSDVRAADRVERIARRELCDARSFPAPQHELEDRDGRRRVRNRVAVVDDQDVTAILILRSGRRPIISIAQTLLTE